MSNSTSSSSTSSVCSGPTSPFSSTKWEKGEQTTGNMSSQCEECDELECKCYDPECEGTGELVIIRWLLWIIMQNFKYVGMIIDWPKIVNNFDRFLTTKHISVILSDMFAIGDIKAVEAFASKGYSAMRRYDYNLNAPIFGLLRYKATNDKYHDVLRSYFKGMELFHTNKLCNLTTGYNTHFFENTCEADHFSLQERNQTLIQRSFEQFKGKPLPILNYLLENMKHPVNHSYKKWTVLHEAILIGEPSLLPRNRSAPRSRILSIFPISRHL